MKRAAQLFIMVGLAWLASAQAFAQDPTQTPAPVQPQTQAPAQVTPQPEPQPAAPAPSRWNAWKDRVFLNANYGVQRRKGVDFATSSTFTLYGETGSTTAVQNIPADGTMIDVMAGVRVYGNLGVAVGFNAVSKEGDGALTSMVPHPLYYDSPRQANGTVDGINHKEKVFHTMLVYMIPIGKGLEAMVSAGPSFFNVEQDSLGAMTFGTETSPYTSITASNATKYTTKTNKAAFNVGLDLTWRFMKNVGIGAFIRHAGTSVDFTTEGGDALTVDVGGLQGGAGIRIRF